MNHWQLIRLGSCTEIARGSSPRPIADESYFYKGTIPWIKIADATASYKYIYETKEHVNEYGASFSRKLPPGSLIVAASGTLGFAIFLGVEGCIHDGWLYFKSIDETKLDKQFLYYLLNTLTKSFNAVSYGAAIQNINTDILRNTGFHLPPIPFQKKIAAILSAYDELIENNKRRIALLEKMAEEIYREWFVRLRFPGHEKVKIVKGVPTGWSITKLSQIYTTTSGGTPSRTKLEYYNGTIPWVKTGELQNRFVLSTEESITPVGLENSSAKTFPAKTILVAMYGATIGQVGILGIEAATNQACCALLPKHSYLGRSFTFHLMKLIKDWFIAVSFGGAQQNISQDVIRRCEVLLPPPGIVENFCAIVDPMLSLIETLERHTAILTTLRDKLLPRLISGKLSVENLDIQFPPDMAEEMEE